MLKYLIPLFALLPIYDAKAQEHIRLIHSCSYGGQENASEYYTFASSTEADRIVKEICNAMGLEKNFVIKSANVRNAVATMDGGKRVILYNTLFLEKFKADSRTQWAAYSVMAHEIGHHLNGHNFDETDPAKRKPMELEADKFSGSALRLLNATLEDAKAGIELFALEGETQTHPLGSARREAVASGWKIRDEYLRKLGIPTSPLNTTTIPDRDSDGVPDASDKCPEDYGLFDTDGCPDADGDDIPDIEDSCKYQKGPIRWQGCPDSDGDGLPDYLDQCPTAAGLASNKGCPPADRDSDGVPDASDKCPTLAGPRNWQGCPDSDGDGIPDHDDKCPNEKGVFALRGCPEKNRPAITTDRLIDDSGESKNEPDIDQGKVPHTIKCKESDGGCRFDRCKFNCDSVFKGQFDVEYSLVKDGVFKEIKNGKLDFSNAQTENCYLRVVIRNIIWFKGMGKIKVSSRFVARSQGFQPAVIKGSETNIIEIFYYINPYEKSEGVARIDIEFRPQDVSGNYYENTADFRIKKSFKFIPPKGKLTPRG